MASCEMCGADGRLFRCIVEGTQMNVCKECSRFGKVVIPPKILIKAGSKTMSANPAVKRREIIQVIVPECSQLVKEKREKLGLKQEELAKSLSEKESIIHKIEAGSFEPSIELAKKLERFLKIKLIEEQGEGGDDDAAPKKLGSAVTIGDVVEIKTRKSR